MEGKEKMSLRVWLPLTKDLRNQGLDDVIVTNNGATYSATGGKLGGCYNFTTTSWQRITFPYSLANKSKFSVCLWIKIPGTTITGFPFGFCHSGDYWQFITYNNSVGIRDNASGSTGTRKDYSLGSFVANQWTHLTFTYNAGTLKIYKDGVLFSTNSTGGTAMNDYTIAGSGLGEPITNSSSYYFNGSINDFRVYDHCLSPMEVKQLSQGLVLHYPLDRQGFGQENLVTPYVVPSSNGPLNHSNGGQTTYYGDYGITIPATNNADTYFSIYLKQNLESGKTYTLSCNVSGLLSGTTYNFPLFAQSNTAMGIISLNHNGLCKLTFTMTYTGTVPTATANGVTVYRMFMDDSAGRTIASGQGAITVTNIKLEEGSIATPWCPCSIDLMYTAMGLDGTTEYDCSGFCNNGTRTGTFEWTSNTPKYAVSQVFNGSNNAIQTPSLPTMITDKNYTIAVWIYKTVIGSKGYQTIYGGPSGFEIEARNGSANETKFVPWNWGKPMASYELNEWNHCVFVHSDSDCKIYLNGEYIATGTAKTSNPTGNYFIGAWNTATQQNFDGLMSDFRIYATALSASDVKSLYQNCATIDPDGTIRGQIRS